MCEKWLESFKIAIIEKNFDQLEVLLDEVPEIKKIEDLRTTVALINEAKKLLILEQRELKTNMAKVKKSKEFFNNYVPQNSFSETF